MTQKLTLPASIEAEKAVLGSVLLQPNVFHSVAELIDEEDFFITRHGMIWKSIKSLIERGTILDYIVLTEELEKANQLGEIGGSSYLIELVNDTPTATHATVYAELIAHATTRRKLLVASDNIRKLALDQDMPVSKVIRESENAVFQVNQQRKEHDLLSLSDVLSGYYDHVEQVNSEGGPQAGVPTGFTEVDRLLGGLQRSDFIVFAGRTGMGKTSWLLSTALNISRKGSTVVIFTMEMSVEQVAQRLISMESGITIQELRNAHISQDRMNLFLEVIGRLSDLPIYLDDTPILTPFDVQTRCRRAQFEMGLSVVVIDYMQLMTMGSHSYRVNRVQEVSQISRMLKGLARELNVTVLAAAQLSRAVEQREDKRPILSDLRESGSIEQDADAVLFMYRDSYYNKDKTEFPGITEVNLAKHRHGPVGTVLLHFDENTTRFSNAQKHQVEDLIQNL